MSDDDSVFSPTNSAFLTSSIWAPEKQIWQTPPDEEKEGNFEKFVSVSRDHHFLLKTKNFHLSSIFGLRNFLVTSNDKKSSGGSTLESQKFYNAY